ncbi:P-loop containing nucleoside triphosphate hydrolase protein, partial [Pelagophyceae sp. CCMP2097]
MIVYSGFKGALDLLEAVLTHEPEYEKVGCARYDGDVAAAARAKALERFKTEAGCCALLATVHCAGVGLNVVEANHVVFLDRWFNPTVHDQAMDRCHRIGQTKPVMVTFLDAKDTVDDIMKVINDIKQQNATVLLA